MYEMFLGPITQSKPWNTQGIEGMHKFLKRFWNLFFDEKGNFAVTDEQPTEQELRILHKTLKKVEDDYNRLSYNTAISALMVAVNELSSLKTKKRSILEPLLIAISPITPHLAEELWHLLGHNETITYAEFPQINEKYLKEDAVTYVVTINGKKRYEIQMPIDANKEEIEEAAINHEKASKYLEGKKIIKIIVVPKKLVNIVVK
jgi:leucyl-tRNA synthetase